MQLLLVAAGSACLRDLLFPDRSSIWRVFTCFHFQTEIAQRLSVLAIYECLASVSILSADPAEIYIVGVYTSAVSDELVSGIERCIRSRRNRPIGGVTGAMRKEYR
jgi:hypothetical protein